MLVVCRRACFLLLLIDFLLVSQEVLHPLCTAPPPRIRRAQLLWPLPLRFRSALSDFGLRRCRVTTGLQWCLMRHSPAKKDLDAMDLHGTQRPYVTECASTSANVLPLALAQPNSVRLPSSGRWASASRVGFHGRLHY
jgi:hypothetical protein